MHPYIKLTDNDSRIFIKISNYNIERATIRIQDTGKMLNNFLKLVEKSFSECENYISKGIVSLDLNEVKDIMVKSGNYKQLLDGNSSFYSKKFMKKSILFFDNEKTQTILHVYLKKEPDFYSEWKIFCIKKEKK